MSVFPDAIDDISPAGKTNTTPKLNDHPAHHNLLADAIEKIQRELGIQPSGPLHATVTERFDDIESAIAGFSGLPADTVVPATTRIIANALDAADSEQNFRLMGDGRIEWGPGGFFPTDAALWRQEEGSLRTDALFSSQRDVGGGIGSAAGETWIGPEGPGGESGIWFGTAGDTKLYRSAAARLKTDGSLYLGLVTAADAGLTLKAAPSQSGNLVEAFDSAGQLNMAMNPTGSVLCRYGFGAIDGSCSFSFGSGGMLIFSQAGLVPALRLNTAGSGLDLKMPSGARAVLTLANTGRFQLGASGALNPGLDFGSTGDTNLYRSAADELKTDDLFWAAAGVRLGVSGNDVRLVGDLLSPVAGSNTAIKITIDGATYKIPAYL